VEKITKSGSAKHKAKRKGEQAMHERNKTHRAKVGSKQVCSGTHALTEVKRRWRNGKRRWYHPEVAVRKRCCNHSRSDM